MDDLKILTKAQERLLGVFEQLGAEIHETKTLNGWDVSTPESWGEKYVIPGDLALIHSEVSEALEAFRKGDRENFAEEMADVMIRVVGLSHGLGIDLGSYVLGKLEKNQTRGYHHGGKRI